MSKDNLNNLVNSGNLKPITVEILEIIEDYIYDTNWSVEETGEGGSLPDYITLSSKNFNDSDFDELRELNFKIRKYDDSNEFSDDFYDKYQVKWD